MAIAAAEGAQAAPQPLTLPEAALAAAWRALRQQTLQAAADDAVSVLEGARARAGARVAAADVAQAHAAIALVARRAALERSFVRPRATQLAAHEGRLRRHTSAAAVRRDADAAAARASADTLAAALEAPLARIRSLADAVGSQTTFAGLAALVAEGDSLRARVRREGLAAAAAWHAERAASAARLRARDEAFVEASTGGEFAPQETAAAAGALAALQTAHAAEVSALAARVEGLVQQQQQQHVATCGLDTLADSAERATRALCLREGLGAACGAPRRACAGAMSALEARCNAAAGVCRARLRELRALAGETPGLPPATPPVAPAEEEWRVVWEAARGLHGEAPPPLAGVAPPPPPPGSARKPAASAAAGAPASGGKGRAAAAPPQPPPVPPSLPPTRPPGGYPAPPLAVRLRHALTALRDGLHARAVFLCASLPPHPEGALAPKAALASGLPFLSTLDVIPDGCNVPAEYTAASAAAAPLILRGVALDGSDAVTLRGTGVASTTDAAAAAWADAVTAALAVFHSATLALYAAQGATVPPLARSTPGPADEGAATQLPPHHAAFAAEARARADAHRAAAVCELHAQAVEAEALLPSVLRAVCTDAAARCSAASAALLRDRVAGFHAEAGALEKARVAHVTAVAALGLAPGAAAVDALAGAEARRVAELRAGIARARAEVADCASAAAARVARALAHGTAMAVLAADGVLSPADVLGVEAAAVTAPAPASGRRKASAPAKPPPPPPEAAPLRTATVRHAGMAVRGGEVVGAVHARDTPAIRCAVACRDGEAAGAIAASAAQAAAVDARLGELEAAVVAWEGEWAGMVRGAGRWAS